MMNGNRLFRALITAVTVLICLWLLSWVHTRHPEPSVVHTTPVSPASNPRTPFPLESLPSVPVQTIPLCALDNTCFGGIPTDISCHTGMLSGGPAREYLLRVEAGQSLRVSVEPNDPDFDVSLALLRSNRECIVAKDAMGPGQTEVAVTGVLPAGIYRLVVGGYHDDCGPYLLTVRIGPAPLALVQNTETHAGRNGTVVRWASFGEVDLTYFSLYRCVQGERERIAVLRAHGGPASFASYRFTDRSPGAGSTYQLEVVGRDGRSELVAVAS